MTIWELTIDRVRVVGAPHGSVNAAELRALVHDAVVRALDGASLPNGRAVKARVEVSVPTLADSGQVARAIGHGVSQAVSVPGRAHG